MTQVIGDKSIFAVEYYTLDQPPPNLHYRYWIGGFHVGAIEDVSYYTYLFWGLLHILSRDLENSTFAAQSKEETFEMVFGENPIDGHSLYFAGYGESLDEFLYLCYSYDTDYHFIWELIDDPWFDHPEYPKGIIQRSVPKDYLIEVYKEVFEKIEG